MLKGKTGLQGPFVSTNQSFSLLQIVFDRQRTRWRRTFVRSYRRLTLGMLSELLHFNRVSVHQLCLKKCWKTYTLFQLRRHSYSSLTSVFTWPMIWAFFRNQKLSSQVLISGWENIQKSLRNMLKTIQVEYFQRCYQMLVCSCLKKLFCRRLHWSFKKLNLV